jgi:hypothetical protein
MYLPALPHLTDGLSVGASLVQLTLTACLVGLAAGQVVAGPISDMSGRRRPLIAGVALYTIASLLCTVATSVQVLIALRFVQGAAGAAGIVIARAVVRDLYDGPAAARFFSLLMLVNGPARGDRRFADGRPDGRRHRRPHRRRAARLPDHVPRASGDPVTRGSTGAVPGRPITRPGLRGSRRWGATAVGIGTVTVTGCARLRDLTCQGGS